MYLFFFWFLNAFIFFTQPMEMKQLKLLIDPNPLLNAYANRHVEAVIAILDEIDKLYNETINTICSSYKSKNKKSKRNKTNKLNSSVQTTQNTISHVSQTVHTIKSKIDTKNPLFIHIKFPEIMKAVYELCLTPIMKNSLQLPKFMQCTGKLMLMYEESKILKPQYFETPQKSQKPICYKSSSTRDTLVKKIFQETLESVQQLDQKLIKSALKKEIKANINYLQQINDNPASFDFERIFRCIFCQTNRLKELKEKYTQNTDVEDIYSKHLIELGKIGGYKVINDYDMSNE